MTVAIIRKDLLERARPPCPRCSTTATFVKDGSRPNTPPVFAIYILGLVCRWLRDEIGGLAAMARHNAAKAKLLYDVLDASGGFYAGHARPECRSDMNVTFRLPDESLEKEFVAAAAAKGLVRPQRPPLRRRDPSQHLQRDADRRRRGAAGPHAGLHGVGRRRPGRRLSLTP